MHEQTCSRKPFIVFLYLAPFPHACCEPNFNPDLRFNPSSCLAIFHVLVWLLSSSLFPLFCILGCSHPTQHSYPAFTQLWYTFKFTHCKQHKKEIVAIPCRSTMYLVKATKKELPPFAGCTICDSELASLSFPK